MPELIHRHDRPLELTLLACCFAQPDVMSEGWAMMPSEVFYLESHRHVWDEMAAQHEQQGGFDLSTITAAFRSRENHDICNGVLYPAAVEFLGDMFPSSAYAHLYAHQLKELYVLREKARAAGQYQAALADGDNGEARLELDAIITALDSIIRRHDERTDEELADMIGGGARYLTGIKDFDVLAGGLAKPGLNILAARPSVGKTSLARTIIRNAAKRGDTIFWYSQDQSENQILELEIARHKRIDSNKVRSLSRAETVEAIRAVRWEVWCDKVTFIDTPLKLDQLVSAIKGKAPSLVVIDYLQIIDAGYKEEYENITATSKALKTLAFALRIPILALAQFNRAQDGKPLNLANLRGSGQQEQDGDLVMALERDTTAGSMEEQEAALYVLKNKVGSTGKVKLHWRGRWASFEGHSNAAF